MISPNFNSLLRASLRVTCSSKLKSTSNNKTIKRGVNHVSNSVAKVKTGELDFENHKAAFVDKTFWEVGRNLMILQLCGISVFAENSLKLAELAKRALGQRAFEKLMKMTAYGQFVAGNSDKEIEETVTKLRSGSVRTILTIPNEEDVGEEINEDKYDACLAKTLHYINLIKIYDARFPKVQLKITSVVPAQILLKMGKLERRSADKIIFSMVQCMKGSPLKNVEDLSSVLNAHELILFERGVQRLRMLGKTAENENVVLLVDAEYTYINQGISMFALAMMGAFNQNRCIVWNTYQCYLKKAMDNIKSDLALTVDMAVSFGAKIVRGAYLERERKLAAEERYPDPTNESYEATSEMYNGVVDFLMDSAKVYSDESSFIVASHNEESIRYAIKRMKKNGVKPGDGDVCFGQLLGMCDQITFPLAQNGYIVYKSMPFGAVDDVLPYLYRRAMENRAVLQGSRKEVALLKAEFRHRLAKRLLITP